MQIYDIPVLFQNKIPFSPPIRDKLLPVYPYFGIPFKHHGAHV